MTTPTLEIDAFVRSVAVNRHSPHAIFLGAGASLSSGVPSAGTCVTLWKQLIFATRNPSFKELVAEPSLPSIQRRIDNWLQTNHIWPEGGQDDYCYFIEKCLPIADDRRRFFASKVKDARPHVGYQLLCLLAEEHLIQSAWTTNFDSLIARATANTSLTVIDIGIDSQHRADLQPNAYELPCYSLHGDYRYDELLNTDLELQTQEQKLIEKLIQTLAIQSLIVSGYSGRDKTVMAALEAAIVRPNLKGNIYWCGHNEEPTDQVARLINLAHQSGRTIFYIPGSDFDDVMIRLSRECLSSQRLHKANAIIGAAESIRLPSKAAFAIEQGKTVGLIKSNAWPITCPSEVFSFDLTEWPEVKVWKWLSDQAEPHGVLAVPFKKVLALGTIDQIKKAFPTQIKGNITRIPIDHEDIRIVDGAVHSLLERAIIKSIASARGLGTDGKAKVWETKPFDTKQEHGRTYAIHRCLYLGLRTIQDAAYLTGDPSLYVPGEDDDDWESIVALRRQFLGYQHNSQYNDDLRHWNTILKGDSTDRVITLDFPPGTAAFSFNIDTSPIFAELCKPNARGIEVPDKFRSLIKHVGTICDEPRLKFAKTAGWNPGTDTLPLRGLKQHGPFDLCADQSVFGDEIRIVVCCPKAESQQLATFLAGINRAWAPTKGTKEDYLVEYSGFEKVFRVPISVPGQGDATWITLPEIDATSDTATGCKQLTRNIRESLQMAASMQRSMVLIFTPDRWKKWEKAETEDEVFDVHDDAKAFAVRRGISTQFLNQDTLSYFEPCRLWWWLSLAIYTKAMRTPWVLEGLDENTAYVGLGYSIDRHASKGNQIVLGCSHLYNAQGQGLQFRLSRVDNPMIRGGNPYLSFDDSRHMGETIRSLFWNSHFRLPERVVIHKLFPYRDDEIKGLRAGLKGVTELELLEINEEGSLRYLNSKFDRGQFKGDSFPIRRGTVLKLADHEALLWIHGATDSVKAGWTYFQGKRRIPIPVVIRRYAGNSHLATIVNEILGLSKMDWNSGDLYSHLPATVKSSKSIARIGSRLEPLGIGSYDYRLFM